MENENYFSTLLFGVVWYSAAMNIKSEQQRLEDGCACPHIQPVVDAAVAAAAKTAKTKRGTFPRFMVRIDEKTYWFTRIRPLEKFLETISIGSVCRVFRNAGGGATIDFD